MSNLVATIHSLVFTVVLVDSSSASKPDKLPSLLDFPFIRECIDFINSNLLISFLFLLLTLIVLVINFLGKIIESFQNIRECCQQYLFRKQAEVSEEKLLKLRKQLLARLKSDISIRRRNSLHNLIKIDLEMEEELQRVVRTTLELVPEDPEIDNPLNREFRSLNGDDRQTTQLRPTQKIIEFFDRDDIQGKLLILGEPGAGKTTELLTLANDLIQRAIADDNAPIPIIFELSSWKNERPIHDWLIEQLPKLYPGLSKAVAQQWINNWQIIPLLDGLDELGLEGEKKCIVALNEFLEQTSLQPGLVVCCRREEYEQAQAQLKQLNGAIYLQPLSDEQIQQYLKRLNRSSIWKKTIVNEPSLLELCRKPLFITMLVVAYQGRAIKNYTELFEAYIEKQLNDPDNQGTYAPNKSPSQKQTLYYLVWLARKLEAERETEFLIERMQPTWLESAKHKIVYRIILGLIYGLIFWLIFWLIYGLSVGLNTGLYFELIFGLIGWLNTGLIGGLIGGLIVGLIGGLSVGLNTGLIFVLIGGVSGIFMYEILFGLILNRNRIKLIPIKSTEKISWSFSKFRKVYRTFLIFWLSVGLIVGLIVGLFGLSVGLIVGLNTGLYFELIFGLIGWLNTGLIFGLIFGLIGGLSSSKIENKNFPNQGIWNSLKNGLSFGLIFWLIYGLYFGLIYGLHFGLICGLIGGLGSVIQHFTLRLILYRNGYIPWNYAKFLEHAVKHRFIQRVGGRYRFMHDLLRKHFAQMPLS